MKPRGDWTFPVIAIFTIIATLVLTFPHQPNRIEINPITVQERRTTVWLCIPISTTTRGTWLTPSPSPTSEHWFTIRDTLLAAGARTLPELNPVDRIGQHLDRLAATDQERALVAVRIRAIVSDTTSPWEDRRDKLALVGNPLGGDPQTVSELLALLPAP